MATPLKANTYRNERRIAAGVRGDSGLSGPSRHSPSQPGAVPRIALTREEAAQSLGMGLTSFKTYVQPHVSIIRRGKLRLILVAELERWAEENGERVLPEP